MSFRVLSSVLFFVAALPFALRASAEEGKFHLVYLVSAVDLKPGSKVYVDPIFFTDGKEVKNFHDYCKNNEQFPNPEQIVGDLKFIENYCAKKSFAFFPKGHVALNNHGQTISLGTIEFGVVDTIEQTKETVMMGRSKISTYKPGTVDSPSWLRRDGAAEYFFLMMKDRSVLEKLVPVSRANDGEMDALARRAKQFLKVAEGKVSGQPLRMREINKAANCQPSTSILESRLENPLVADFDLDGRLDMIVSVYTIVRAESETDKPLIECLTRFELFGDGDAFLLGNTQWVKTPWARLHTDGGEYERYRQNGYAPHAPLMAVTLRDDSRVRLFQMGYIAGSEMKHPYGLLLLATDRRQGYSLYKFQSEINH